MRSSFTTALLAVVVAAVAAIAAGSASGRTEGPTAASGSSKLIIWADVDRTPAVKRVVGAWAAKRRVNYEVVTKQFGNIRDDLTNVSTATAPDVVVGAHDWTGQLAANGLVVPLNLSRTARNQLPPYARAAFSYGRTTARLYGVPVAIENIGLVVNTKLVKVPKTWAQLEASALAFKRKGKDRLAIAVQNAPTGDTYHHQPFLTGLCGYIFGRTKGGALNPNDIGLRNPRFLKNASMIDRWNKTGLINGKVDSATAQNKFLDGKAAYWVTGPWNIDTLNKKKIKYQVIQIPKIKCRAAPFLGAQGFYVTRYARQHGLNLQAKDLVSTYMATAAAQRSFYAVNGRYPANTVAGKSVRNRALAQFGRAGVGGEPMPNIPQMSSVWDDTNAAWVKTLKGAGATPARRAFLVAARNIASKIG